MNRRRRDLLQAAAALGILGARQASAQAGLPKRVLGKTGLEVSILGLGGARIGTLPDDRVAADVVRLCYDQGVNYFDTAAAGAYGLSQARYGRALKGLRDKVVLATKTRHRTFTQAQLDLNQSLANMGTDHVDIYQIHNVMNEEDIEFIFAPRGVMEMVEKARQAGKVRFVGVTAHADPKILNRILEKYAFDTVLMPLSVTDGADPERSFEKTSLPVARRKQMGIIAMKTLGAGAILQKQVATVPEALRYVWSLPVSTAILGCNQPEQVRADARLAQEAKPLSASAIERLRRRVGEGAYAGAEPWKGVDGERTYRAD
jgi:uncharacterized protein